MNFTSFTGHIPATIPTIHQFAAKFGYEGSTATQLVQVQNSSSHRYHNTTNVSQYSQQQNHNIVRQTDNVVVSINNGVPNSVSGIPTIQNSMSSMAQDFNHQITIPYTPHVASSSADVIVNHALKSEQSTANHNVKSNRDYSQQQQRENVITHQNTVLHMQQTSHAQPVIQTHHSSHHPQQLVVVLADPKVKQEIRVSDGRDSRLPQSNVPEFISSNLAVPWQSLAAAPGVADYLSLGLQHLLKYTGEKRDDVNNLITAVAANGLNNVVPSNTVVVQASHMNPQTMNHSQLTIPDRSVNIQSHPHPSVTAAPKKKKKKQQKEPKPRPKPGEIRLTTALDGSTLYCCPECHMAYPERGLLEQHLLGHTMERRYICDICNAALKRKDHLTRHKQSHNPERPYVCSVCLKAFKRKEQLTLHTVIHTGEKRHVCNECGKGFYRKDHLRKHTRSHIARRVKAELSQSGASGIDINSMP